MSPASPPAPATDQAKFVRVFLNATACYLLAWLVVSFIYQASMAWLAHRQHVPGVWQFSGVRFNLPDSGWRYDAVISVYGTGPLLLLALAGLALGLFWKRQRTRKGLAKLLLLWLGFHAINQVFGGLLADTATTSGWWYVPNWLAGNNITWVSAALGIVLAVVQLVIGYAMAIPFLLAQDSRTIVQYDNRFILIGYALLGPWLAGSALLALSKLPHLEPNEVLHYATMGLLLVPLALGLHRPFQGDKYMTPRATHVAWGLVGLALLGLLAWRLALGGAGVRL